MTNREKIIWAIGRYGTDPGNLVIALEALGVPDNYPKFSACLTDVTNTLANLTLKKVTPDYDND